MNFTRNCLALALAYIALSHGTASAILTGEYLFESSNVVDTSGSLRDGTPQGAISFGPGLYPGSSVSLRLNSDGTTASQADAEKVQLPNGTNFITDAPGATLAAWVRLEGDGGTGNRTIISVSNGDAAASSGGGAARATIQISNGQFRALGRQNDGGGSSSAVGTTAPVAGTTYFIAGVFNYIDGYVRLFVDGQQVANTNVAGWNDGMNSANSANLTAALGTVSAPAATQEYWPGLIDGARIFNTALTNQQILDLFNNPDAIPDPFTLGDTDNDGIIELSDLTPIRQNYLQSVTMRSQGDLTGDNLVNFADFRQWKTAWLEANSGSGSLAGIDFSFLMAVPEPSAMLLCLVGLIGVLPVRRVRSN